jgi:hypothetical protein
MICFGPVLWRNIGPVLFRTLVSGGTVYPEKCTEYTLGYPCLSLAIAPRSYVRYCYPRCFRMGRCRMKSPLRDVDNV